MKIHPMSVALAEAKASFDRGEVPVGAAVVMDGKIIARNGNRVLEFKDPSAHAEILVLRSAGQKLQSERLLNCDLYVTLEPCMMCACAISLARINRLYYGAKSLKDGAVDNDPSFFVMGICHHAPEVYGGFMASSSEQLLRTFFVRLRDNVSRDTNDRFG